MKQLILGLLASLVVVQAAVAAEYPIGACEQNGAREQKVAMEIRAVYLQPVEMDPPGLMRPAKDADIHLEADIHATANNPMGFPEGEWVPYLIVNFALQKHGSQDVEMKGMLMPMVANDGPHYGDNVKLIGPGKYTLKLCIHPPKQEAGSHFGRHIDKETGVGPWFKPFELKYEFVYAGTGKKGGY